MKSLCETCGCTPTKKIENKKITNASIGGAGGGRGEFDLDESDSVSDTRSCSISSKDFNSFSVFRTSNICLNNCCSTERSFSTWKIKFVKIICLRRTLYVSNWCRKKNTSPPSIGLPILYGLLLSMPPDSNNIRSYYTIFQQYTRFQEFPNLISTRYFQIAPVIRYEFK